MPALLAALVAAKTGRPARCVFGHDQDFMHVTGKRHPYLVRYEVGFDDDGRITALTEPTSSPTAASRPTCRSPSWSARCCTPRTPTSFPNCRIHGPVCRTNLPSNTAFRGFGGPQAVAAIENIIEEIAAHFGKSTPSTSAGAIATASNRTTSRRTARSCETTRCRQSSIA